MKPGMQDLPHHYHVSASAEPDGNVSLRADDAPQLVSAPAAAFGGPGDQWSPEMLLVGAVVDGFTLSFRAIARSSNLAWNRLECAATGVVARVDGTTRFTEFNIEASLTVPEGADGEDARRLLEKARDTSLIRNSLSGEVHLGMDIAVAT